ncbi:hypothetical protein D9M70_493180 [compost metagenome]
MAGPSPVTRSPPRSPTIRRRWRPALAGCIRCRRPTPIAASSVAPIRRTAMSAPSSRSLPNWTPRTRSLPASFANQSMAMPAASPCRRAISTPSMPWCGGVAVSASPTRCRSVMAVSATISGASKSRVSCLTSSPSPRVWATATRSAPSSRGARLPTRWRRKGISSHPPAAVPSARSSARPCSIS